MQRTADHHVAQSFVSSANFVYLCLHACLHSRSSIVYLLRMKHNVERRGRMQNRALCLTSACTRAAMQYFIHRIFCCIFKLSHALDGLFLVAFLYSSSRIAARLLSNVCIMFNNFHHCLAARAHWLFALTKREFTYSINSACADCREFRVREYVYSLLQHATHHDIRQTQQPASSTYTYTYLRCCKKISRQQARLAERASVKNFCLPRTQQTFFLSGNALRNR